MNLSIKYLRRQDIDSEKWDRCLEEAPNGLIYGYTFYLDAMAKNWDALVLGNYEAVMPLTWNRKFGIYYLYQPPFTASLGVFGKNLHPAVVEQFLSAIPKKFRLIEIDLNAGNFFAEQKHSFVIRTNYVLRLDQSYENLVTAYRDNVKRNIKKAREFNCRFSSGIPIADVITLAREQMKSFSKLDNEAFARFRKLFDQLYEKKQAAAYGIYTEKNELLASCVYFFSHKRAYYILVGNHPNSKAVGASHFLIDRFIHQHAGENLLLDFEGSDLRNLAFFYSSFGAKEEVYPAIKWNRLPWWVKLLKN
jgi:hypothetical protein